MSWDISWHFTRGERIVSSWMHWEKHIELTFHSKGDLYCIKGKVHIWMPMPIPRCRCRVFQMALLKAKNLFHWNVSWNLKKTVYLEFNVKIHCEINVKLVLHEILWKKIFSVSFPLRISFEILLLNLYLGALFYKSNNNKNICRKSYKNMGNCNITKNYKQKKFFVKATLSF